jgi:hypothetical protein
MSVAASKAWFVVVLVFFAGIAMTSRAQMTKPAPPTPIDEKKVELGGTPWNPQWDEIIEKALPAELLSSQVPQGVRRFCPRHAAQINLQGAENTHLQDTGLFYQHGSGVALFVPHLSVVTCCQRNGGGQSRIQAQSKNDISKKFREVAGAFVTSQRNAGQFSVLLFKPQPILNRRFSVALQYCRDGFRSHAFNRKRVG